MLFLRSGLIFVFAYVPVASFLDPASFYHYLPSWSAVIIPANIALLILGIFEIILCLWFIWGKQLLYPSLLAGLVLLGIVVFNFNSFSVVFRNIAIVFSAFALAALSTTEEQS